MKDILETLKNSKTNKSYLYSFYNDESDIKEGDKVLFACKCGDGDGVLVKCIINKITYLKSDDNKIYSVGLKLDDDREWIPDDNTIKNFIKNGVLGYKIKTQLLKLEN